MRRDGKKLFKFPQEVDGRAKTDFPALSSRANERKLEVFQAGWGRWRTHMI